MLESGNNLLVPIDGYCSSPLHPIVFGACFLAHNRDPPFLNTQEYLWSAANGTLAKQLTHRYLPNLHLISRSRRTKSQMEKECCQERGGDVRAENDKRPLTNAGRTMRTALIRDLRFSNKTTPLLPPGERQWKLRHLDRDKQIWH